ncbi:hypothetical protein PR202_gb20519 [Eleusine coracana subsp. coracana]|uniref:Disease resistance N-terminal domain-containing protein n=1 Tax=Eleusine coracana subsp. coracana TaxID=191504 RepID=A0AAV5FBK3_ELECO|nr:hypothetical protein PR202_gb20519 [Eleusine coracana subsp. coracana]
MHAALCKVAEVPSDQLDEKVKLWVRDIRELSYNIENILDTFLVRVQGPEACDSNRYKRAAKKIASRSIQADIKLLSSNEHNFWEVNKKPKVFSYPWYCSNLFVSEAIA